ATTLINGRPLRQQEIELGGMILPALLMDEVKIAMTLCSNRMHKLFGEALHHAYPDIRSSSGEDKYPQIRWTSTLPAGPLPILPPQPDGSLSKPHPDISIKITLPLYGVANDSDNQLVIMLPPNKRL